MKPQLRVLFVFNNTKWTTIPYKLSQIKEFFISKIELVIDTKYTNFNNIPFETIATIDGTGHQDGTDVASHSETVKDTWLDENVIKPFGVGYDIVVFVITDGDKQGHITASGIRGDRDQGAVECIIFGGDENWNAYVNGVSQGNNFVVFSCHEISHAIYMILGKPDNTHKFFYSGTSTGVLNDFDFPLRNAEKISLIQKTLALCYQLLGYLQLKQKTMTQEEVAISDTNKVDKIKIFCDAIESREGYIAPCPDYPKGTPAWRNKNPGNAKYVGQVSAIGKDSSGFAIFPTKEIGYAYLYNTVKNTCKGLSKVRGADYTIYEFFTGTPAKNYKDGYAPSADQNDPKSYAEEVAKKVGVSPYMKMRELL